MEKQSDHDLLIRVDETVKSILIELKDMKLGTADRLHDHEDRIRFIERWMWVAVGGAYALMAGIQLYSYFKK